VPQVLEEMRFAGAKIACDKQSLRWLAASVTGSDTIHQRTKSVDGLILETTEGVDRISIRYAGTQRLDRAPTRNIGRLSQVILPPLGSDPDKR